MTRKNDLREILGSEHIVAVVREETAAAAWDCAVTFVEAGMRFVEITFTTPDAASLIERLTSEYSGKNLVVAAGSVRSTNQAAEARRAGAKMLVSPHTDFQVIDYATEHDLFCVAGAATATEVIHAWEAGADIIKIYPAVYLGGPDYIRTLRSAIRDVPMLAGGPVSIEQIEAYLDAGCVAVNLGPSLAPPKLVGGGEWDQITQRCHRALEIVHNRYGTSLEPTPQVH